MSEEILVNVTTQETRVAVIENGILQEIQREARQFDANKLLVVASQTVIDTLLNDESTNVVELESVIGRKINFQVETSYTQEQFDIVLL